MAPGGPLWGLRSVETNPPPPLEFTPVLKGAVCQEREHRLAVVAAPRHRATLTAELLSKTTQQGVKEEELTRG